MSRREYNLFISLPCEDSRQVAIHKPGSGSSPATYCAEPWPGDEEPTAFCCLSCPAHGILLWQSELVNTFSLFWRMVPNRRKPFWSIADVRGRECTLSKRLVDKGEPGASPHYSRGNNSAGWLKLRREMRPPGLLGFPSCLYPLYEPVLLHTSS